MFLTSQALKNLFGHSSSQERQLYEDPPHVKWELIEQVLKGMFKETGLGLNSSQLDYIRRYIFGKGM